jgi:cytochrome c-type biogenesis protein CcmE
MNIKVILGIVAIVGFTSLMMYNFGESLSEYTDFESAGVDKTAHIVGNWVNDKPYGFSRDSKQFSFYMSDEKGNVRQVVFPKPKPNNFEDAERLVVIGEIRKVSIQGQEREIFYANDMLMKCPSKYNEINPEDIQGHQAATTSSTS